MRDAMRELKSSARSRIADIARAAGGGTAMVDPVFQQHRADVELMTEKQVLGFKASRLEYVGDQHHEQVQNRKHRT
jgi:hypothetical protein